MTLTRRLTTGRAFRAIISIALMSGACRAHDASPLALRVRIATGTPGGGFYPLGEALAASFARSLPHLDVMTQATGGAVSNVEAVQEGRADLGLTFADVAYVAFIGRLDNQVQPFTRLRAIAVLQVTPVHLVVAARSGITSVSDLNGRRVGLGPEGSGTALTADLLLHAFGVDPGSIRAEALPFNEAARRLTQGTLDATFDNGNYPVESVRRLTAAGAHLLPLRGPAIERLRHDYPFLRLTTIPAETYPAQAQRVRTIGVDTVLVCRADLDETFVHDLTKRLFEVLPSLAERQSSLRLMDIEQAPATPIPLHEGAARYYRERELTW